MGCSDIRKMLNEHIEGSSPPAERALVEEHLRSCPQCMLYAAEIKKAIETLQGLDEVEPPAGLTEKVMKKIRTEASPKKGWVERLFFPLHVKLPIEAFAALLITVAAIVIYKGMEPELRQMEVQPQAPVMKVMPAEPKIEIQKKETKKPKRITEEPKHKDSFVGTEHREMTTFKEEKRPEQIPPAPAASYAPSPATSPMPSLASRQIRAGKGTGMEARDEMTRRAAPASAQSELSAEKQVDGLATITLTVKALDNARREIDAYVAKVNGELKTIEHSESRIIITVKLDPAKAGQFLLHLGSLGRIREDLKTLSPEIGLFKLIIEKR